MSEELIGVNDVYDYAFDIAQEFDNLVQLYDIENFKPLINKVISVLEILESCARKIENLQEEMHEVKTYNLHLSSEKLIKDLERAKLKQAFEEIEECWLQEISNLKEYISALKSEKDFLKCTLALKNDSSANSADDALKTVVKDQENLISKLKSTIVQKEKQLHDNLNTISALNCRIQELLEMNKILYRKKKDTRKEISKLKMEKEECKSLLILQKKENLLLTESLNELVQSNLNKRQDWPLKSSKDFNIKSKFFSDFKLQDKKKDALYLDEAERSSFSKSSIHKIFHLFLGIATLSELCLFRRSEGYWFTE